MALFLIAIYHFLLANCAMNVFVVAQFYNNNNNNNNKISIPP